MLTIKKEKKIQFKFKNKVYHYLGNFKEFLNKNNNKNLSLIIAIGSNYSRKKMYNTIKRKFKKLKWATVISKDAIINNDVKINEGSAIMSGCIINTGTSIGKHCFINTSSSIDHDNKFEDFSSTGPGVKTGGNVIVNKNSYIGIGATVVHNISIGKNTVIGGNSYVNKNCSHNAVYFGIPAKKIRNRNEKNKYL